MTKLINGGGLVPSCLEQEAKNIVEKTVLVLDAYEGHFNTGCRICGHTQRDDFMTTDSSELAF
jgi:hypothetical protein